MTDDDNITPNLTKSLCELIASPTRELSEIIADNIKYYRWRSLLKIADRASQIRRERNICSETVPIKMLIPLLEEGSKENEDSEMLDLWANLLANSNSESNSFDLMCVNFLSKITHIEARIIEGIGKIDDVLSYCINFFDDRITDKSMLASSLYADTKKIHQDSLIELSRLIEEIMNENLRYHFSTITWKYWSKEDGYTENKYSSTSEAAAEKEESYFALENLGLLSRESIVLAFIQNENKSYSITGAVDTKSIGYQNYQRDSNVGPVIFAGKVFRFSKIGHLFWKKVRVQDVERSVF